MSLASGTRFGSYQILAPLGAGGMGEVYRASDTKLGRQVAVKVLPSEVAHDAERLQRLRREAQMLAALNHPRIAAIHGLEEANGHTFLVLELVEGEDLAARLAGGALPVDEAIAIARQIAEALEAAHESGIVHRDLKPANVKLTKDGTVKLLDFGLAKAFAGDGAPSSAPDLTQSPTLSHMATQAGVILGTAPYMSPEQARGRPVDKRADVWAFGVVLWEMLTGKRLFTGETASDVLAAVLKTEPDLGALPPETPPLVKSLLRRCLRKDPKQRLHDIADARLELEEAMAAPTEAETRAERPVSRVARALPWGLAAALLVALASAVLALRNPSAQPRPPVRFTLSPPAGSWFSGVHAVSGDGRSLVYGTQNESGRGALWMRSLDILEPKALSVDALNVRQPSWSPDGRSIVYATATRLMRLDVADGRTRTLCESRLFGASWGAGEIVFVPSYGAGIHRVSAEGGTPSPVTALDAARHEVAHLHPKFLRDGRRFVFFARVKHGVQAREGWICSASLDGKEVKRLRPADFLVGVSDDRIVFMDEETLLAQRYDPKTLALLGDADPVPGRVARDGDTAEAGASVSRGGTLVLRSDPPRLQRIVFVDRAGKRLRTVGAPDAFVSYVRLSPDGTRLVSVKKDARTSLMTIWLVDVERGTASRLGGERIEERFPALSPDGSRLVLSWDRDGPYDLVIRTLDGSAPDRVLLASPFDKTHASWSRDGASIVFTSAEPGHVGFRQMPADGGAPTLLLEGEVDDAELTPDGRWLLYESNETGRQEIYARRLGPKPSKVRVSADGGRCPRVRADGREVYFLSPDDKLMAAAWEPDAPGPGAPAPLFQLPRSDRITAAELFPFDVARDGKSFVIVEPLDPLPVTEMTVVLDGLPAAR